MTSTIIAALASLLFFLAGSLSASDVSLARVAMPQLKVGETKGSMTKGVTVELKYAYARKVHAFGEQAYSLVLTDHPYPEDTLKRGEDLSSAIGLKNHLHFLVTTEGKVVTMSLFIAAGNRSASKVYPISNRKSVNIKANSIEGELSEEDSAGSQKWNYGVVFKSLILKQ